MFVTVGMCEQAVTSFVKVSLNLVNNAYTIMYYMYPQMNQPQNAIDCCVELNQVNRSLSVFLSLSHTHTLSIPSSLPPFLPSPSILPTCVLVGPGS